MRKHDICIGVDVTKRIFHRIPCLLRLIRNKRKNLEAWIFETLGGDFKGHLDKSQMLTVGNEDFWDGPGKIKIN